MKFLTLFIAIYAPLLCYASNPRIVFCEDCAPAVRKFTWKVISSVGDHMETTDKLIEKNPNSFVMKEIAGVSGLGAIAYSELHFQNVAEIIKQHVEGLILADKKWNDVLVFHSPGSYTEKNEIPVVHSPEPNTLHISCAQMASESKPFIEEIPGVENAEYLRLTAKFLKNSAESNPVTTLDEDVKSYKKAVTVSRNSNFFEFPIPTNPITTMGDLLPKSRLLMGEAIKHRQRTNYRTLSMQDSRRYFEGPGLIIFLAYADPELFGQTMVEIGSIDLGGRYIAKETVNALRETTFQEGVAKAVKASKTATKKKPKSNAKPRKKNAKNATKKKLKSNAKPRTKNAKNASNETPQPSSSSSNVPSPSPPPHDSSSPHARRPSQKARV